MINAAFLIELEQFASRDLREGRRRHPPLACGVAADRGGPADRMEAAMNEPTSDAINALIREAYGAIAAAERYGIPVSIGPRQAATLLDELERLRAQRDPTLDSDSMTEPYLNCPQCGAMIRARMAEPQPFEPIPESTIEATRVAIHEHEFGPSYEWQAQQLAVAALAAAVPHIERAAAGNALDAAADEVKRIREHGLLPHEHYGPYDTGFEKWLRNLAAVARGGEATE